MKISNQYTPSIMINEQSNLSLKKSTQQPYTKPFTKYSQLTTKHETAINSKKVSKTQQQIYSHQLINQIMMKRHNHTVNHQIGQFDSNTQLYGKPINPEEYNMLQFSDQRQMYQSQYTKQINQINKKLNSAKPLSQRIKNRKQQDSNSFYKTRRPHSANNKPSQNVHKKISVSGLVSYNFNSVNARKNLGFDFEHDQDKLNSILSKLQTRNKCCVSRQHSLIQKKKVQKAKKQNEIKQAIFCDFDTQTNKFLGNLHEQITQQQMIYGMKWQKLLCIKQLMEKENIKYDEAESIVNQIQEKKIKIKQKQVAKKRQNNDQNELNNRKQVVQRGRIMLKNLYFTD